MERREKRVARRGEKGLAVETFSFTHLHNSKRPLHFRVQLVTKRLNSRAGWLEGRREGGSGQEEWRIGTKKRSASNEEMVIEERERGERGGGGKTIA